MKSFFLMWVAFFMFGCSSVQYHKTVEKIELSQFMGRWYVQAGRFTFLEKGAHNAVEVYSWDEKTQRILIDFTFAKDGFDGEKKSIPQTGWILNKMTNAHWKVSPFWPLRFDYLVIDVAEDYSWTAIGVPSQKYLWIMSREWSFAEEKLQEIFSRLRAKGYDVENTVRVPQKW